VGEDCDDNNPSIYPGAPETKHDGIDQDCNGYDLTIDITRALYRASQDKLVVYATSDYQDQAALSVTIVLADGGSITRTMTWKAAQNRWQRSIGNFSRFGSPVSVMITGPEGAESAQVTLK
jgi:bacillopeptidase F